MQTKLSVLIFSVFIFSFCACQPRYQQSIVNWNDSSSVIQFIQKASLCEEILVMNDSLNNFIKADNFSVLVWESVNTQTKENIVIPISKRGDIALSLNQQKQGFRNQIEELKLKFCK